MPILSARGLDKAYGARPLLKDATFTLKRGEKAALLGPNGTGKSTLLRILAGIEPVDAGVVDRRREASMLYLPQEPVLDAEKNAREIVAENWASGAASTRSTRCSIGWACAIASGRWAP